MLVCLARWARRLSGRETAEVFAVRWEAVYRSVQWIVAWGRAHRGLAGITALGLDDLHWRKGKRADTFRTLIYQVDAGCRRLLWVGLRRTERTLRRGLKTLGAEGGGRRSGGRQRPVAALPGGGAQTPEPGGPDPGSVPPDGAADPGGRSGAPRRRPRPARAAPG
jgi:hypothetical protein